MCSDRSSIGFRADKSCIQIFGMNIQEINESGPSIVAFISCAIAMWAVIGTAWLCWQAKKNLDEAKSRLSTHPYWKTRLSSTRLSMKARLVLAEYRPPGASGSIDNKYWPMLYYMLGFGRLQKTPRRY